MILYTSIECYITEINRGVNNEETKLSNGVQTRYRKFSDKPGHSIPEASKAVGTGVSAIRKWVKQLTEEQRGITPQGSAITLEQRKIQELDAKNRRLERENEIIKKATALLISDAIVA